MGTSTPSSVLTPLKTRIITFQERYVDEKEDEEMKRHGYVNQEPPLIATEKSGVDGNTDSEEQKTRFFGRSKLFSKKNVMLILCATGRFFAACSCSLIGPFYSIEAQRKGVSLTVVGLVYSIYGLVIFLVSPIFGKYITRIGVNFVYLSGIFVGGSCTILFGVLDKASGGVSFAMMCIVCRSIEAVGFASFANATMTTVSNAFREHSGKVLALIQTSASVGFMIGPVIGGFLYDLAGFGLPFYVIGSCTLLNGLALCCLLPEHQSVDQDKQNNSMLGLLSCPMVIIPMFSIFSCTSGLFLYDSIFSTYVQTFHLSGSAIGGLLMILPLSNVITTPLWAYVCDDLDIQGPLMIVGQLMCGISFFINGSSPLLPFVPLTLWTVVVTNTVMGISFGILNISSMKCMLKGAHESNYSKERIETYSLVSGVYNTAMSCAEFCGPLAGTAVVEHFGFPIGYTLVGIVHVCMMIVLIVHFSFRYIRGTTNNSACESDLNKENHVGD